MRFYKYPFARIQVVRKPLGLQYPCNLRHHWVKLNHMLEHRCGHDDVKHVVGKRHPKLMFIKCGIRGVAGGAFTKTKIPLVNRLSVGNALVQIETVGIEAQVPQSVRQLTRPTAEIEYLSAGHWPKSDSCPCGQQIVGNVVTIGV